MTAPLTLLRALARRLEAVGLLVAATAAQVAVPMPRWSFVLGEHVAVPEAWRGSALGEWGPAACSPVESGVVSAVEAATRVLPWKSTCLAQAAAAQVMLRRRGTGGVVVIGLRRAADGRPWDAHAWLMSASGILLGRVAAAGYTATGAFVVPGRSDLDEVASLPPSVGEGGSDG